MTFTRSARLGALLAAFFLALAFAPSAFARSGPGTDESGGQSTPGITITAQNPGTSPLGSPLRLTLTAHSERKAVPNPDCRPATATRPAPTLRCWGSLLLRVPSQSPVAGGLVVVGFQEVHKVAVGETSCGDDQGGDCDGDEGGSCEEGGCEGGAPTTAATLRTGFEAETAYVNGLATVVLPGRTTLQVGQVVQVHITLYDNSNVGQYQDQVLVQVRPKGPMQDSIPWTYQSGLQTIQQVRIHYEGAVS